VGKGKSTDYAFITNTKVDMDKENLPQNMEGYDAFLSRPRARENGLAFSSAIAALASKGPPVVEDVPKPETVEKPRAIAIMTWLFRGPIFALDAVGYEAGKEAPNSALKDLSKVKVLESMTRAVGKPAFDEVITLLNADASSWGPWKVMAQVLACLAGLGARDSLYNLARRTLSMITRKQVRPNGDLLETDHSLLERVILEVAHDILKVKASKDKTVPHPPGMMNGLLTGLSDLQGAVALGTFSKVAETFCMAGHAVGTNDDTHAVCRMKKRDVKANIWKMAETLRMTSIVGGIEVNVGKAVTGTTIAELNTVARTEDSVFMPYIRTVTSCAGLSTSTVLTESCLTAISAGDACVREGGPLFLAHMAVAYSYASLFERTRLTKHVFGLDGRTYLNQDPTFGGKPVFGSAESAIYGPLALAVETYAERTGSEFRDIAVGKITQVWAAMTAAGIDPGFHAIVEPGPEWASTEVTEMVFRCMLLKRENTDLRFKPNRQEAGVVESMMRAGPNSKGYLYRKAVEAIRAAARIDPYKASDNLHSRAAMRFDKLKQRVSLVKQTWAGNTTLVSQAGTDLVGALHVLKGHTPLRKGCPPALQEAVFDLVSRAQAIHLVHLHTRNVAPLRSVRTGKNLALAWVSPVRETLGAIPVGAVLAGMAGQETKTAFLMMASFDGEAPIEEVGDSKDVTFSQYADAVALAEKAIKLSCPRKPPQMLVPRPLASAQENYENICANLITCNVGFCITVGEGKITLPARPLTGNLMPVVTEAFIKASNAAVSATYSAVIGQAVLPGPVHTNQGEVFNVLEAVSKEGLEATRFGSAGKKVIKATLPVLAASNSTISLSGPALGKMSSIPISPVIRGFGQGQAVKALRGITSSNRQEGVVLATLTRTLTTGSYVYTLYIVSARKGSVYTYNGVNVTEDRNFDRVVIQLLSTQGAYLTYALHPAAICLVIGGIPHPVMEAQLFTEQVQAPSPLDTPANVLHKAGADFVNWAEEFVDFVSATPQLYMSFASALVGAGYYGLLTTVAIWVTSTTEVKAAASGYPAWREVTGEDPLSVISALVEADLLGALINSTGGFDAGVWPTFDFEHPALALARESPAAVAVVFANPDANDLEGFEHLEVEELEEDVVGAVGTDDEDLIQKVSDTFFGGANLEMDDAADLADWLAEEALMETARPHEGEANVAQIMKEALEMATLDMDLGIGDRKARVDSLGKTREEEVVMKGVPVLAPYQPVYENPSMHMTLAIASSALSAHVVYSRVQFGLPAAGRTIDETLRRGGEGMFACVVTASSASLDLLFRSPVVSYEVSKRYFSVISAVGGEVGEVKGVGGNKRNVTLAEVYKDELAVL